MSQIRYDRSLIVPLKLKAREKRTHGSTSFLTRESTIREEKEKDLVKPIFLIEEEEKIFRTKLDRIRINLAVSSIVVRLLFSSHLQIVGVKRYVHHHQGSFPTLRFRL